jgi:hypothetical protein
MFKDDYKDNLYIFKIYSYFLYKIKMFKEIIIKVYPLTIKVKVLCINKSGTRGVLPLKYIKRIKDYIRLKILL